MDLSYLSSNKSQKVKYNLISVLIHEGFSTNSGHYYCYVKNSNDLWYCMNDSSVCQVSLNQVRKQSPYLLFYEKVMPEVVPVPVPSASLISIPKVVPEKVISQTVMKVDITVDIKVIKILINNR